MNLLRVEGWRGVAEWNMRVAGVPANNLAGVRGVDVCGVVEAGTAAPTRTLRALDSASFITKPHPGEPCEDCKAGPSLVTRPDSETETAAAAGYGFCNAS